MNRIDSRLLFNDLRNDNAYLNLDTFCNRRRGEWLRVRNDGLLVRVEGMWEIIRYWKHRTIEERRARLLLQDLLPQLQVSSGHEERVFQLFKNVLAPISRRVYHRGDLSQSVRDCIQRQLSIPTYTRITPDFQSILVCATLSNALGGAFHLCRGGSSGVYIAYDLDDRTPLGAVKPAGEEPTSIESRKWTVILKNSIFSRLRFLKKRTCFFRNGGFRGERRSFVASEVVEWGIVPQTVCARFQSFDFYNSRMEQDCSFQAYLPHIRPLDEAVYGKWGWLPPFILAAMSPYFQTTFDTLINPRELAKHCIFQYLIGESDGHLGNLVASEGRIWKNDNGWAWPHSAINDFFSLRFWNFLLKYFPPRVTETELRCLLKEVSNKEEALHAALTEDDPTFWNGADPLKTVRSTFNDRMTQLYNLSQEPHPNLRWLLCTNLVARETQRVNRVRSRLFPEILRSHSLDVNT